MANCRYISTSFWSDAKVVDDFTPEDRYIYIYCLTNPHTTLCGCYEISIKQIATETGYSGESAYKVIRRLDEIHQVLRYNSATKEILLLNWAKYNWTGSNKIDRPLLESIRAVKCPQFRNYLGNLYNARTTITEQYDPSDPGAGDEQGTPASPVLPEAPKAPKVKEKPLKHKYGEYGWVRLTDAEYERLLNDLGEVELNRCIAYLDESAQSTHNKNKWSDWNVMVRKCNRQGWGLNQSQVSRPAQARQSPGQTAMSDLQLLHQQYSEEGY